MEACSSRQYFLASLLIFFTLISVFSSKASAARPAAAASRTGTIDTRFIRTSCGVTTYPKLCFASLSSHASAIGSDPKLLAHAALSASLESARSTSAVMVKLAHTHGLTPRVVGAMRDCMEELGASVDQLRKSLREMNQLTGSNYALAVNNIQTWVSAALTDEETCSDGFAGKSMNGNTKVAVREGVVNVAHMTSNALALINSYASLHN